MKKIWLIMIIALIFLVSGASAQLVSFADPDSTTHRDVYVYNATGDLRGVYNTTSSAINITGAGDLVFVFKPQYSSPLDDPTTWLSSTMSWASTNVVSLVVITSLIGILLTRR